MCLVSSESFACSCFVRFSQPGMPLAGFCERIWLHVHVLVWVAIARFPRASSECEAVHECNRCFEPCGEIVGLAAIMQLEKLTPDRRNGAVLLHEWVAIFDKPNVVPLLCNSGFGRLCRREGISVIPQPRTE
eukprot:1418660-Prymnesium_polylepis.2